MPKDETEGELIDMRCRSCGQLLGYRRRLGPFIFWCSEECADTPMPKFDRDQIRDEVAVELYLAGVPMMELSRFTQTPYTRLQQLLYRRSAMNRQVPQKIEQSDIKSAPKRRTA